jgi:NAD(P)-dependent dehydrogenase (short-subunit alcohol dehydrogenase family)
VLFARKPDSYNDIVSEIKNSGGQAYGITADVTDLSSIDTAFEQIKKELPSSKLAAAIFNVNGGFVQKPFLELNMQVLDESLAVAT